MIELDLDILSSGEVRFRGESPPRPGEKPVEAPLDALLEAVRDVVWYKDEVYPAEANRVLCSDANLYMFLSDVRSRRFKEGIFVSSGLRRVAGLFRDSAALARDGKVLPSIVKEGDSWFARWTPAGLPGGRDLDACEKAFAARALDYMMRRAGRTPLERDGAKHFTCDDAWLAALRSDSGLVRWEGEAELEALSKRLAGWRLPLMVSPADRKALVFSLEPPPKKDGEWLLKLAGAPKTRTGLMSLGAAAALFPPLKGLKRIGSGDGSSFAAGLSQSEAESFLSSGALSLSAAGYEVKMPPGVTGEHLSAEAELTPEGEEEKTDARIGAKLRIRVDGEVVSEEELRFLLEQNSTIVFFRNRWIEVDRNILKEALRAMMQVKGSKMKLREAVAVSLGLGRAGRLRVESFKAHGWLRGLLGGLSSGERFRTLDAPAGLSGKLRDYQLRGASWLHFLAKWGFGPCLADDMGLGKTVQAIAFLLMRGTYPAIVVSPVTVTANWMREFARFAPSLKVYLHQGPSRLADWTTKRPGSSVTVTSYSLLVRDLALLRTVDWRVMVLDEAQMVKNPDSRTSLAARSLDVPVKVALTGTPIENSALDVWSLEEFLNPGLLGARADFMRDFVLPIRTDAATDAAKRLKRTLQPFLLRRLKSDPGIASELGDKRETREYCPLTARQRRLYEEALDEYAREGRDGESSFSRRGRVLKLITRLKEVCDSPMLACPGQDEPLESGKMSRLNALLEEIFDAGESALIFTQYARMGEIMRSALQETFGRRFPFLHGSLTPKMREAEIAAFNSDHEPTAFILSLKAGGFGLTLTRATHVIHFDRWWNPAVEAQATDRAHRIGQTRDVMVHTFISPGTVEDHVDRLLSDKRLLAGEIVTSGESFLAKMSDGELERMVSLDVGQ